VGPTANCGWIAKIKKQLRIDFHAFLLSLITDNLQLTFPTVLIPLSPNFPTVTKIQQIVHRTLIYTPIFNLPHTVPSCVLPLSHHRHFPSNHGHGNGPLTHKFFCYNCRSMYSIDELNPNFLPHTVLLSHLLLQPRFYFTLKPPTHRTTPEQASSPLSLLSKRRSKTQTFTDLSLHCYNCRKNPRDSCWERSTSEIPVSTVRSPCQFCLTCCSKSNFCNRSLLFLFLQNKAAGPCGLQNKERDWGNVCALSPSSFLFFRWKIACLCYCMLDYC